MRHLSELLGRVAELLSSEASARAARPGLPSPASVQRWEGEVLSAGNIRIRPFHWIDWTLLTIERVRVRPGRPLCAVPRFWVTVHFFEAGANTEDGQSPGDTPGSRERLRADRELRRAFRRRRLPPDTPGDLFKDQPKRIAAGRTTRVLRYKTLPINPRTPTSTIQKQLAVYFAQENLADESVYGYLYTHVAPGIDADQQQSLAMELILNYVDPGRPESFGAYVRQLRRRIRSQAAPVARQAGRWSCPSALSLPQVERYLGVPYGVIRRMIDRGQVSAMRSKGTLRVASSEIQKIVQERVKKRMIKECISRAAFLRGRGAARRWVERRIKQGVDPGWLLQELKKDA